MRAMIDTNILVSAMLFPNSPINAVLAHIISHHTLVISSFVIEELRDVVRRKFPGREQAVEILLEHMRFELAQTPRQIETDVFEIRDMKDYPVLYTAMREDVDVLITGEKDFAGVAVDRPKILTPAEYRNQYMCGKAN